MRNGEVVHHPSGAARIGQPMTIRAHVTNGRIVVDEPTLLPDGTTLDLVVDDEGDELDTEERAALQAHLQKSFESVAAGRVRDANELIDELRARR
jgi:hypothetical protein